MNGQTAHSASKRRMVTGANTTTAAISATAVALSTSRARASRMFQNACRKAAASARLKARGGIARQSRLTTRMGNARALMFDFNGTLSQDEPLLLAIYQR